MAVRKEISKVTLSMLGYGVEVSLSRLGIYDHLSPLNQALLSEAKKGALNSVGQSKVQYSLGWQILRAFINWTLFKIFILCKPVRSRLEQSKQLSILALLIVVCCYDQLNLCHDLRMTKTKRNKQHEKVLRGLLKELPYFNCEGNLADFHGRFNNFLQSNICSKRYLDKLTSLHELDLS